MAGITRDYWLDYAMTNVSNSIVSRENAAKRLDDFLFYVWGVYTMVFALGSALQFLSSSIAQLIVVIQPVFVIMLSRFFCVYVSMPGSVKADPNVVTEIIYAHTKIVSIKRRRLRNAIIATVISMLSLCAALAGYNALDPNLKLKNSITLLKFQKEQMGLKKDIAEMEKKQGSPVKGIPQQEIVKPKQIVKP